MNKLHSISSLALSEILIKVRFKTFNVLLLGLLGKSNLSCRTVIKLPCPSLASVVPVNV